MAIFVAIVRECILPWSKNRVVAAPFGLGRNNGVVDTVETCIGQWARKDQKQTVSGKRTL